MKSRLQPHFLSFYHFCILFVRCRHHLTHIYFVCIWLISILNYLEFADSFFWNYLCRILCLYLLSTKTLSLVPIKTYAPILLYCCFLSYDRVRDIESKIIEVRSTIYLLRVRELEVRYCFLYWEYENYPLVYFGIRFAHISALCLRIGRVKLSILQELVYNFVKYVWKE